MLEPDISILPLQAATAAGTLSSLSVSNLIVIGIGRIIMVLTFSKGQSPIQQSVARKFHFIWIGGKMPEKYMNNLRELALICRCMNPPYELNIWADKGSLLANVDAFNNIIGLKVRMVEEELLKPMMEEKNSPYSDFEKMKMLKCLFFEYLPPQNYAAVADFLRVEVLRQNGGIYIDTDNTLEERFVTTNSLDDKKLLEKIRYFSLNKTTNPPEELTKKAIQLNDEIEEMISKYKVIEKGISAPNCQNDVVIVSNDGKTNLAELLKSMLKEMFNQEKLYFKDVSSFCIAKKLPISIIPVPEQIKVVEEYEKLLMAQCYKSNNTPRRQLTIEIGPGQMTNYLYNVKANHLQALFLDRVCDSTWIDKNEYTKDDKAKILSDVQGQVQYFLDNIYNIESLDKCKELLDKHGLCLDILQPGEKKCLLK